MPTNKVTLRTVEEVINDYKPNYRPIYGAFLGKSQQWKEEVGALNFKRAEAVSDIRAKHITPKDTELRQVAVGESARAFKKYFLANQYIISTLQDREGTEGVVAQVLDEHNKQFDEMLLLGEGTSGSNVINNGLYWSGDANYVLETSAEVDTTADSLIDLQNKVLATAGDADSNAGQKLIIFYGSSITPLFDGVYASYPTPFKSVLKEALGDDYTAQKLPSAVTPSGANGYLIVNLDLVTLHYMLLPNLQAQGVNEEKMYAWFNFLMGSCMLELHAPGAIIRQPLTLEV